MRHLLLERRNVAGNEAVLSNKSGGTACRILALLGASVVVQEYNSRAIFVVPVAGFPRRQLAEAKKLS